MKHTGSDHPVELTLEQKRTFYRDGFIILKNIVPKELTHRARRLVNITAGQIVNGTMDAPHSQSGGRSG